MVIERILAGDGAEAGPGIAASGDDRVVGVEAPGVEEVVLEELPQILDRIELRAVGWQRQEGDVVRHPQGVGGVPAGLIEDDDGMGIGRDVGRDLGEVQVHGRGVDVRKDQGGGRLGRRADGGEDIGGGVALVARLPRPAAAARPLPRQLALLADPGVPLARPRTAQRSARLECPMRGARVGPEAR